ncbi:hypothetical protein TSUD_241340 [Trifolium subterraneum]|uniref:RNase H type-1 domain-containing protein n=1 Tax=Trifolium subterraneum TaxID=3900 RepID=A0A2Z6NMJ8_TRISU|nr:hypothetical protein TSUD_241340 [Trifolium subterraneum]
MNQACIAKLVWGLQEGVKELWSEVLLGKYKRSNNLESVVAKPTDSSLWKAIANLWNKVPEALQNAKVADLVNNDDEWNWELLRDWLPEDIMHRIAAISPPSDDGGNDCRRLNMKANGGISVSSMYKHLCNFDVNDDVNDWKDIWRLKVPERVRTFIWLMRHNRLLTNEKKHKMGLGSAMCDYCGSIIEDTLHALRDCPQTMPIWLNLVNEHARANFFNGDLFYWINYNMSNYMGKYNGVEWKIMWVVACHQLWFWRNKEKHEESFSRPSNAVLHVMNQVKYYQDADCENVIVVSPTREVVMVGWKYPPSGWVKLNTDGSCRKDGRSGCGGVIRGSEGEWIGGFAKFVGRSNVYVAELWGVFEGLKFGAKSY